MNGVVLHFGHDRRAVKTYGLLKDAGYYAHLEFDVTYGFVLTTVIPSKGSKMTRLLGKTTLV